MDGFNQIVGDCIIPSGNFLDSCWDIDLVPYHSKDAKVPSLCLLSATCDSGSEFHSDVRNEVYLPTKTSFTKLSNNDGILTFGDYILAKKLSVTNPEAYSRAVAHIESGDSTEVGYFGSEGKTSDNPFEILLLSDKPYVPQILSHEYLKNNYECKVPSGSFIDSCTINIKPYSSTDKNLEYVELCKADLVCNSLNGKVASSTVYFNINEKGAPNTVQKIENCNGSLVVGNLDNQCKGKGSRDIEEKANKYGKSGNFKI